MALYKPRQYVVSKFVGSADGGNYEDFWRDPATGAETPLDYNKYQGTGGLSPEQIKLQQAETDKYLRSIVSTYGTGQQGINALLDATAGDFTRVKQLGLLPNADWNQLGQLGSSWQSANDPGTMGDPFNQFLVGAGALLAGGAGLNALGAQGAAAAGAGDVLAGGEGLSQLVGSAGTDALAGEFTGGLTGAATGSPGLAAPSGFSASALGAGGASAAPGLTATAGAGALAPGFFAAETMSPLLAAGGAAAGGTAAAGGAAGVGTSILNNPALLGAGLGAAGSLLGSGNSPAGNVTTTQDIPEWLKGYAKAGMGGLMDAFQAAPGGVNPLTSQGAGYLSDVIGGDYLNSNPYLDAMFNRAAGQVGSKVNSQFTAAGRYGSGAHQGVLGESLGNLATDIYGGNYARERANQQAAALGSGAFGNMMIDQPFRPAQNLLSGVGSIKGGTTTSPYFNNQFGDILSGAMGGALLGKMFS